MLSVRNIIVDALSRATLANRKQGAPADLVEDAYKRFCGILRDYSDNNFITAYRGEVDFLGNAEKLEIGGVDIPADKISKINSLFYKNGEGAIDWMPMSFVALEQFYDARNNDFTYSWQPKGANLFTLYLKPRFVKQNRTLKLIFNQDIKIGLDEDVNLPNVYTELLIRAVAYAMAVDRPRASDTKRNELKEELRKLEKQIEANNADNRILLRENDNVGCFTYETLLSGLFLYGR